MNLLEKYRVSIYVSNNIIEFLRIGGGELYGNSRIQLLFPIIYQIFKWHKSNSIYRNLISYNNEKIVLLEELNILIERINKDTIKSGIKWEEIHSIYMSISEISIKIINLKRGLDDILRINMSLYVNGHELEKALIDFQGAERELFISFKEEFTLIIQNWISLHINELEDLGDSLSIEKQLGENNGALGLVKISLDNHIKTIKSFYELNKSENNLVTTQKNITTLENGNSQIIKGLGNYSKRFEFLLFIVSLLMGFVIFDTGNNANSDDTGTIIISIEVFLLAFIIASIYRHFSSLDKLQQFSGKGDSYRIPIKINRAINFLCRFFTGVVQYIFYTAIILILLYSVIYLIFLMA